MLFNRYSDASLDSIRAIELSELKIIYRNKAFETHPDRARVLGKSESEMIERFKEISSAYAKIFSFISEKHRLENDYSKPFARKCKRETASSWKNNQKKTWRFNGSFSYSAELLLGQFLYFSGVISWKELLDAIKWQRSQRPVFGKIAIDWLILSENEVLSILKERHHRDRFGEYALRNGYINSFELMAILGKQRMMQKRFGEYFIKKGIATEEEMEMLVQKQKMHNGNIRFRKN